jgi:hypothetical protein
MSLTIAMTTEDAGRTVTSVAAVALSAFMAHPFDPA